jgi:SAM-dependent methyltransferase
MFPVRYHHHNWLVKKIGNEVIRRHKGLYRGVLYDLGCGTKPYQDYIRPMVDSYVGVDWSNTLHEHHMDVVADLNKPLPIADAVADTVLCLQVLEHLSEPQAFLGEAYRIMKPDAQIMVTVPFMWHVHEAPYDFFRYTEYGLQHLMQKTGFRSVVVTADSGFWTMLTLKINYQTFRYGKRLGKWVNFVLVPFWLLGQVLLPLLDKWDKNPRETTGYCVIAKK